MIAQTLSRLAPVLILAGLLLACAQPTEIANMTDNVPNPVTTTDEPPCPEYTWPLAEPAYNSKIVRDLSAFEAALAAFPAGRAAELDALLTTATIPTIQALLDSRTLTSVELVTYYVDRIRRYDIDRLNAVMTLNPAALAIAAEMDAEREAGARRGPLHGIPVLLKDNIATGDGMATTAGAYALRDWRPARDAFLAGRLREAGAIILGKTNLSEFANYTDPCTPNGFSTLGGQTQNPHGSFDPLGSSSGSAVATAANFAAATIGTETQGSLIMPAVANGIFTLKTSRGLVSRAGIVPLLEAQDVPGPMTRTATDLAVLLAAMAGPDANDPATAAAAGLDGVDFLAFASADAARRVRVGVPTYLPESVDTLAAGMAAHGEPFTDEQHREMIAALPQLNAELSDPMVAMLEKAGLQVVRVDAARVNAIPTPDLSAVLPYGFRHDFDAFAAALGEELPVGSLAEVAAINAADPANRVPYGQRHITEAVATGAVDSSMTAEAFAGLITEGRAETQAGIREVLARYGVDVLYLPHGQQYAAAGFPALSVPAGLGPDGKPVGLPFIADFLGDGQLIAVAYALEQAGTTRPVPELDGRDGG